MYDPVAFFFTWTTYGSWLPGDSRGWVNRHRRTERIVETPSPGLATYSRRMQNEPIVRLDRAMRSVVDAALRAECEARQWPIHALDVRTNHVHIVFTAPQTPAGKAMGLLKSAGSSALSDHCGIRRDQWWTREGSKRRLTTQQAVDAAVRYVEGQDLPKDRRKRRYD